MTRLLVLLTVLTAACNQATTMSPSPIQTEPAAAIECPQSSLFPTETERAVFFAPQATGPGTWAPAVEDAWKGLTAYRVEYTFTPDETACAPAIHGYDVPAVVCPKNSVFNPNAGEHGSCEGT